MFAIGGGQLTFTHGNYSLNTGATVAGSGFADVAGATLTLNNDVSAPSFQLDSGTITGRGNLNIGSVFNATSGVLSGTGMVNIAAPAVANVSRSVHMGPRRVVPVTADLAIVTPAATTTVATATAGGGLDPQQFPTDTLPWRIATFSDGAA